MEELIREIVEEARTLGACHLLTGKEKTIAELVELLRTPQGVEFCSGKSFPSLSVWRRLKEAHGLEEYGIYVDAGRVEIENPAFAVFVGETKAVVNCDTLCMHDIVLLQGASAVISASDWAVCGVHAEDGCSYMYNITGNAIGL